MHSPAAIGAPESRKRVSTYDPHAEAESVLYKDAEGIICIPHLTMLGTLREAAKEHKAPGKGRRSLSRFILSGVRVHPEMIPLNPQEWTVDARPVVVQRSRIMRWRPRFDNWSLSFDLEIVDPATITPVALRNVLDDAGRFVGICDFRPLFGTFTIAEFTMDGKTVR